MLHTQALPQVPSLLSQPRTDPTGGFVGVLLCSHPFDSSPSTHCPLLTPGHAEQPHCLSDPLRPPQTWCPPENCGAPLGMSWPLPLCPVELCIASCSMGHPVGFLGHLASVEGLLWCFEVRLRLGTLPWGERPRYSSVRSQPVGANRGHRLQREAQL